MQGRNLVFALVGVLSSCSFPLYQPLMLHIPGVQGKGVLRSCIRPLLPLFPRLKHRDENILITKWKAESGDGTVIRRRAEITASNFKSGTLLEIVVKRMRLGTSLLYSPQWVEDGGDHLWEEKVLQALQEELGGRRIR